MRAHSISLDKAKQNKLFYFVANVVVLRTDDARCLILKRALREIAHPGKWGVIGGKLEWNNLPLERPTRMNGDIFDFEDAVEGILHREAKEEANIEIKDVLLYLNSVAFVRPDGVPVVLVKFAAEYKGGEVRPEKGSFTDFAWVNADEVQKYNCIDGVKEEVKRTIELFS
ncbi:NUDIX domain-containing protein [Candidatus Kaiserbacteria bacterium]|nr:NUDIX domain-containing protein [Candidatus Kaiserbacteria bacterium]